MKRDRVVPTSVGTAKNNVIFCQPGGGDMVRVVKHRGEILKEEVGCVDQAKHVHRTCMD